MQDDVYLGPRELVGQEESRLSISSYYSNTQLVSNDNSTESAASTGSHESMSVDAESPLKFADLVSFAWQIACGMVRPFNLGSNFIIFHGWMWDYEKCQFWNDLDPITLGASNVIRFWGQLLIWSLMLLHRIS